MRSKKYDVIVVGGGAAGLILAKVLAEKNVNFALLEKNSRTANAATAKSKGLVSLFPMDNPARLRKDLGHEKVNGLLDFYRRNNKNMESLLQEFKIPYKKGIWYGSCFDMEMEELKETAQILKDDCTWETSAPFHALKEALYLKTGISFDAKQFTETLAGKLEKYIFTDENALAVEKDSATKIITEHNIYETEVAIICLEAYTPQLFSGWGKFFYPLRAQILTAEQKVFDAPAIVNYGHEIYVPEQSGTWMGGINPNAAFDDMTYDETPTDVFQNYMEIFFEERWGVKPVVSRRDAGTVCMTQTGLPFIGPVPGRVDLILFGGFCARGWDYIAEGANAVAALLLNGKYILPDLFRPSNVFV